MEEKNFYALFRRFQPTEEQRAILDQGKVLSRKIDEKNRVVVFTMAFPRPIRKESLYEIEQGIGEAYQLNSVFLMPEYPQETFYEEYFREAVKEASRVGVVSKGFFEDYTYRIEGREITVSLPFGEGGLSLLEKGRISEILERILKNEFGLEFSVRIRQSKSSAEVNQE